MKATHFLMLMGLIILIGCGGTKTATTGSPEGACLVFIGEPRNYTTGVTVKIDEEPTFSAEVGADLSNSSTTKVYPVPTGKHFVTVSHNGAIIYKKQVLVKVQETKKIVLP